MALDATARESNYRDSVRKYLIDNLYTGENIKLLFDKFAPTPDVRDYSIDRWVSIMFKPLERGHISEGIIDVIPCTRKDTEGFRLAQLTDTVYGYLTDSSANDGMRRIPLYRSKAAGSWDVIGGGIMFHEIIESEQLETDTEVKFKVLTVTLKFASKV